MDEKGRKAIEGKCPQQLKTLHLTDEHVPNLFH